VSFYVDDNSEDGLLRMMVLGENGVLLSNTIASLFITCPSKNGKEHVNSVLRFEDLVKDAETRVSDDCETNMQTVGEFPTTGNEGLEKST
jgi:hypothetical protein